MKIYITSILMLFGVVTFGQEESQLSRDTARANYLYSQCETLSWYDKKAIGILEEAVKLYDKHPLMMESIIIKHNLLFTKFKIYREYAKIDSSLQELVLDVKNSQFSLFHKEMYEIYTFLYLIKLNRRQNDKALFYADEALKTIKTGVKNQESNNRYLLILLDKVLAYEIIGDNNKIDSFLLKTQNFIDEMDRTKIDKDLLRRFYSHRSKYYYNAGEMEKAIIMTEKSLIFLNDNSAFVKARIHAKALKQYAFIGNKERFQFYLSKILDFIQIMQTDSVNSYPIRYLPVFYNDLSEGYRLLKDYKPAIEFSQKAIESIEEFKINNEQLKANCYILRGICYHRLEDYDNSIKNIEKALEINGDDMLCFVRYAENLIDLEQYDEALKYLQKALILNYSEFESEDIFVNPSKELFAQNIELADKTLHLKGYTSLSKAIATDSVDYKFLHLAKKTNEHSLYHANLLRAKKFRSDEFSLFIDNRNIGRVLKNLIEIAHYSYKKDGNPAHLDDIFQYFENYKSSSLVELLYRKQLPDSILQKEKGYLSSIRTLQQEVDFSDSLDLWSNQDTLITVSDEYERFIRKNKEAYPVDYSHFENPFPQTRAEIQKAIPAKKAIISYAIQREELFIEVLTQKQFSVKKVAFYKENTVEQVLKFFKDPFNRQRKKRETFINQSHELYQALIAPILEELTDIEHLIIIPDNELFYLPFETLLKSNDKKAFHELDYLIKDFSISYHYSGVAYIHQKSQETTKLNDLSLLAVAPVFDKNQSVAANRMRALNIYPDSTYRSFTGNSFSYLPNTEKEVKTIKDLLPNNEKSTILLRQDATKQNVYQYIEQPYQFIHFATHGLVNEQSNKYSSLIGYNEDKNSLDRFLFINEIQSKTIQADLVVLSSCESGIGQLWYSEGMIALNRGFLYAGANNVLYTHWKIQDLHSSNLMIDFYKNYLTEKSYAAALRQAKLNFLKDEKTANPSLWAAFMLIGE